MLVRFRIEFFFQSFLSVDLSLAGIALRVVGMRNLEREVRCIDPKTCKLVK